MATDDVLCLLEDNDLLQVIEACDMDWNDIPSVDCDTSPLSSCDAEPVDYYDVDMFNDVHTLHGDGAADSSVWLPATTSSKGSSVVLSTPAPACYRVEAPITGTMTTVCLPTDAAPLVQAKAMEVVRAPAHKRSRSASVNSAASDADLVQPARSTKRRRVLSSAERADIARRQAEAERALASAVATTDPRLNAERLSKLATVKRNGNYDSYVGNAALGQPEIPLLVSLVGTETSPGLLKALQQTKRKGVTDVYLSDRPRGIPKWVLFFRTIFGRLARLPRFRRSDPFFTLFRSPSGLHDVLVDAGSNAGRVALLVSHLARMLRHLRPHEGEFFLPPAFVAGITPAASVEECMKLRCDACGAVQGWRTCRGCYKAARRKAAREKSEAASAASSPPVSPIPSTLPCGVTGPFLGEFAPPLGTPSSPSCEVVLPVGIF